MGGEPLEVVPGEGALGVSPGTQPTPQFLSSFPAGWPDWYSQQITKGSSQALGFAPDPGAAAEVAMGAGINIHWKKQ